MAFQYASAPLGIGQLLDQGLKLFRHSLKPLLPVIVLMMVVTFLSSLATGPIVKPEDFTPRVIGSMVVSGLIFLYLYMVMIFHCVSLANSQTPSLGDSFSRAVRKIIPLFFMYLLYVVAITIGMIFLLIPGFILMVSLMLAMYAIAIEDAGPFESLKRSHFLVWGNWWRTATIVTVAGLLLIVVYMTLGFIVGLFSVMGDEQTLLLATNLLTAIAQPLMQPLFICILLVQFHDLLLRKEGGDLESAIDNL